MRFQAPRGTEDVLPGEVHKWQHLERTFRELVRLYGYEEIRTPTFEDKALFVRTSGETSDIVSKEMYEFRDKGDREIALKPEGTAPAIRAVIGHNLCPPGTVSRLYYITPIFRYGRPQKGRLREAHQVGLELIGSPSPAADAEVIEITIRFYEALGIESEVLLNSIGREQCRARYRDAILAHMSTWLQDQSDDIRAKTEKNPLRLVDSKDPDVQEKLRGLPPILDFLEDESRHNFEKLLQLLACSGVPYRVAPEIVRGLDYYTETVFEVQSGKLGAQSSLCGGGRYDCLVKDLGGPSTPSVGVAMGIERALIVMSESGTEIKQENPLVFVVQASPAAEELTRRIARELRQSGIATLSDIDAKSMKSQLRQADKSGAKLAVIIGEDELKKGVVTLRDLASSQQEEIAQSNILEAVRARS